MTRICGKPLPITHGLPGRPPSLATGYTLIEVLLASVIIVVGMTGILTMQVVGIRITENAYHRTQATTLAYQMTDYLRANCPNLATYDGVTACKSGSRHPSDNQTCNTDGLSDINADNPSIAEEDLAQWWDSLNKSSLPHWFAEIQSADEGVVRTAVQWDKERVAEQSPNPTEQPGSPAAAGRTSCLDNGQRVLAAGIEEVCLSTIPCRQD